MEERVEDYIKRIETLSDHIEFEDYDEDVLKEASKDKEAIEELLKAYKELKEIEESHRKENGELRERVKELEIKLDDKETELQILKDDIKADEIMYKDELSEKYIPVSLVEEKIEEHTKLLTSCNRFSDVDRIKAINERILAYKELLEKRK